MHFLSLGVYTMFSLYVLAEATTGDMGGVRSHEFSILSPAGEDVIYKCSR